MGESGRFVQTFYDEVLYVGGFMGNVYNFKLGIFKMDHRMFNYDRALECDHKSEKSVAQSLNLGRMGHLAFWDHQRSNLILFGGQRAADHSQPNSTHRPLQNDVLIYDITRMRIADQIVFSEATIGRRMYHAGFKIDDSIFSIGGQGRNGKIYDEFIEINIRTRRQADALVSKGRSLIGEIYSTAITPVFYRSKMSSDGSLNLASIAGEINWGDALELIKYEGFYMFGGRLADGEASDQLLVLRLHEDRNTGRAKFKIDKPKMTGRSPPARYMHSIDYIARLGLVAIYGGRDDTLPDHPILDDLWVIKLFNMEYLRVQVGGSAKPSPRCNHCSFVNGSELIVCGGQGAGFKLSKAVEKIELDQELIDKTNPILSNLSSNIGGMFGRFA